MEENVVRCLQLIDLQEALCFLSRAGLQETWNMKCMIKVSSLIIQVVPAPWAGCGHSDGQLVDQTPFLLSLGSETSKWEQLWGTVQSRTNKTRKFPRLWINYYCKSGRGFWIFILWETMLDSVSGEGQCFCWGGAVCHGALSCQREDRTCTTPGPRWTPRTRLCLPGAFIGSLNAPVFCDCLRTLGK